eukprot:TRINITY_DN34477_c0_g1_i1.p1 TRINITY_DN34477_c0_g1~~TRINITY_DN34477_c0_g1_i1.p1  ORF type:complete len:404 (+),score=58.35 TRINITY_DN34477_c0_g1_i1:66-1277(+)
MPRTASPRVASPRMASPRVFTPRVASRARPASPSARSGHGHTRSPGAGDRSSCYRCTSHGRPRSKSPTLSSRPQWVQPQPSRPPPSQPRVGRHKALDAEWAISTDILTSAQYPNWTLSKEERKVKALPSKPDAGPVAGQPADARPAKSFNKEMTSYPNWTLSGEEGSKPQKRTNSPAKRYWNRNDDIEGSRPAIGKFSPRNQKIMADPWPDRATCPVQGGHNKQVTNTIKANEDMKKLQIDGRGRLLPENDHQLYNKERGTLRTKEIERFRDGRYVTTEVVTHRSPGPARGSFQEKHDSPRAVRTSSSLCTNDIEGARPRTPRNRTSSPSTSLRTMDIEGAQPRATPPRTRPQQPPVDTGRTSRNSTPVRRPPPPQSPRGATPARQSPSQSHATIFSSQITFF